MLHQGLAPFRCQVNGFLYLGKDEEWQCSLPTSVVLKLMEPLQNRGYNVRCDNLFTSLDVTRKLAQEKTRLVFGEIVEKCLSK